MLVPGTSSYERVKMTQLAQTLLRNGKTFLLLGLLVAFLSACGGDGGGGGGNSNPPPGGDVEDTDGDGVADDDDNCPAVSNADQADSDGDGVGDACEDGSGNEDTDGDGVVDSEDNCPANSNADQADGDGDGIGDVCDDGSGGGGEGLTFETFQSASLVIGQPDFAVGDPNQGGAPDANTLNMPLGGIYSSASGIVFIADSDNSRVLGFNGVPDTSNMNADFVLGQPDFTTTDETMGAGGMFSPEDVSNNGGNLMVTDTDLNRVTVYDGIPTAGGVEPVLVVGQPALDAFTGACDQSTLIHPHAHWLTPDGKLLVADAGNNRVLVWNAMPTTSGAPADFVLGQVDFENCSFADPENFRHPAAVWSDGEMLIVADSEHHRILIYNTFPTENFQTPDVILGQADMQHIVPNDDNQDGVSDAAPTARTLSYPRDLAVHDGKLYVADMDNHRVLIWNEIPTASFAPADNVLGQPDFTSGTMNAGADTPNEQGFRRPVGVSIVEDDKLFVTEWENSRVMVFEGQTDAAAE